MADNYLEKKMEEFKAMPSAGVASKNSKKATTLSKLVAANRLYKSFNNRVIVREQHLKDLINFVSAHNKLHYYPTINNAEVSAILDLLKKQNPDLFNFENQEQLPKSFILIGCNRATDPNECNECNEPNEPNRLYFQLGAISHTLILRATEMGLNGTCTILSGQDKLQDNLQDNLQYTIKLPFTPLVAIAIGKGE